MMDTMKETDKIEGLVAATFTPMHDDGSVAYGTIPAMIEFLKAKSIENIYICGSTGEGPSLTLEERKKSIDSFVESSNGHLRIIVNVGHDSVYAAKELATHAQKANVYAISAPAPSYYKISNVEDLVWSMAEISAGAPDLPFYYYHVPVLTAANLNMVEFLRIGSEKIPKLRGIKYSAPTLHEFSSCLNFADGKFDILFGSDEMMLGALSFGAKGFIGSTYNFAASIYQEVMKSFHAGDLAKAKQHQEVAGRMVDIIYKYNGLPTQKVMMKLLAFDCGPVRLPLIEPSEDTIKEIAADLVKLDLINQLNIK